MNRMMPITITCGTIEIHAVCLIVGVFELISTLDFEGFASRKGRAFLEFVC